MPRIIAAGVGLPLIGTGATVTTSQPLLDLSQRWNAGAVAFSALKLNITDTASASGSLLLDLQVGGASKFSVTKTGEVTAVSRFVAPFYYVNSNTGAIFFGASLDTVIQRDGAANTLALRNGTAAQTFNVYNTYTDASNYERATLRFSTNNAQLLVDVAGTGSGRALQFGVGGAPQWQLNTNGHFTPTVDNTYDIGESGANRPRNIYVGSSITAGGSATISAGGYYGISTRNLILSPADGITCLSNWGGTITTNITLSGASGSGTSTATFGGTLASATSVWAGSNSGVFIQGRSGFSSGADGTFRIQNNAGTITTDITLSGASTTGTSTATFGGGIKTTGATFALQTATTLTDNAAAQVATMTNGPTAGNPTKWIAINDNGVTRYIPAW